MKLSKSVRAAAKRIRPLRDLVALKPLEFRHPTLYVAGIELRKGIVVAVGPGRRMRRKVFYPAKPGQPRGVWLEDGLETGKIRPMRVRADDCVEFGFRNVTRVTVDGEDFVIVREQNIYGTSDASQSQALLEPQPAGYDRSGNFVDA